MYQAVPMAVLSLHPWSFAISSQPSTRDPLDLLSSPQGPPSDHTAQPQGWESCLMPPDFCNSAEASTPDSLGAPNQDADVFVSICAAEHEYLAHPPQGVIIRKGGKCPRSPGLVCFPESRSITCLFSLGFLSLPLLSFCLSASLLLSLPPLE